MATTVAASFARFRQNLAVTDLQSTTLATRQQAVRKAVEKDFVVLKSFLTGSYKRSTLIAPLKEADLDIFVVLDSSYFKADGHAALLDKVRATLLKTYTKTPKISRNGHAVTVTFTDFVVDVVPAFYRKGGGYLIPDSVGKRWISTDPTVHEKLMSTSNSDHGGDLVPVVKMLKRWNRQINRAFRSFYIELIAIEIFDDVILSNDWSAVRYFFDHGRTKIKYKAKDPAGYGDQINGLNGVRTVADGVSRFETAYSRALRAEQYASVGKTSDAVGEWIKVFGSYFPSYG
jgi:Second Messenger Oligonucleotide or Dinucleotide Synthetase domain